MPNSRIFSHLKEHARRRLRGGSPKTELIEASAMTNPEPGPNPVPSNPDRLAKAPTINTQTATELATKTSIPPNGGSTIHTIISSVGLPETISIDGGIRALAEILNYDHSQSNDPGENKHPGNTTWLSVKIALEVLGNASEVTGQHELKITRLDRRIDWYERAVQGHKVFSDVRTAIDSLLRDLSRRLGVSPVRTTTKSVQRLCRDIKSEFHQMGGIIEKNNHSQRHAEALKILGEVIRFYWRIHTLLERLVLNVNANMWKVPDEQVLDVRLMELSFTRMASYNSPQSERLNRGPCRPGDREEELGSLFAWGQDKTAGYLYWMDGLAKTGKTTMAYSICAKLDEAAILGASFFCSKQLPGCHNAQCIFPSIVYQLAQFSRPFFSALSRIFNAGPIGNDLSLMELFDTLISRPFLEVKDTLPDNIIVVIDALDECESGVEEILDVLLSKATPGDLALPLRFLISSRPTPEIARRMESQVHRSHTSHLVLHGKRNTSKAEGTRHPSSESIRSRRSSFSEVNPDGPKSSPAITWASISSRIKTLNLNLDSLPPLKLAIAELDQFINVFEAAFKGREDSEAHLLKLDSLIGGLIVVLGGTTIASWTFSMGRICRALREELEQVGEASSENRPRRWYSSQADSEKVVGCYRRIINHLERLMLNADQGLWKTVDKQVVETRLRFLLPSSSVMYNSAQSDHLQRGSCTPTTRRGELEKLLAWARSQESTGVFWLNGMAGTGKTTIAYSLCCELEASAELGASFFCTRQLPECRDIQLIIPAIAYQLARFSIPFQFALSIVLEADPDMASRGLKAQFENLLVKPLVQVKHTLPPVIVVVIDALDECEDQSRVAQVLDLIISQTASSLPIRFFISSRPEPEIYYRMMRQLGNGLDSRLVLHEVDREAVNSDIKTYLQTELADVGLASPQLEALVRYCGTLFLSASTVVRYVREGILLGEHEERLDQILRPSSRSINHQHGVIDALYMSLLAKVFSDKRLDESGKTRMKILLETVVCAREPLTTDGLAGLLRFKSQKMVNALLQPLRSVIYIAEDSGHVSVLHGSFPDFLLDPRRSLEYHCNSSGAHSRMARACFRVIQSDHLQFNICGLGSSYVRDADVIDLAEHIERTVSPHLFYSCLYLATHLELGGENHVEELYDFLSLRLLLWIEVLNLKQSIHSGPVIMQRLELWARDRSASDEVIGLAQDAWRFVTMFAGYPVSQSTPHIYVSMLPFWPGDSPLIQHYLRRLRASIGVSGPALTRRNHPSLLATWAFGWTTRSCCFSPDGSHIAAGIGSSLYMLDGAKGDIALSPLEHGGDVLSVAFSPDGVLVASGSTDFNIRIWNVHDGQATVSPLAGHTGNINSVCFTPDGRRIVSGSDDSHVLIWDVRSAIIEVGPLVGHAGRVWSVCVSPDGLLVASGSGDTTLRIWSSERGQLVIGPCEGHNGPVSSVQFSPNGSVVASASSDKTIRIWAAQTGQCIAGPLEGHTGPVMSAMFSPDGRYIVSGSRDRTIRLWDSNGDSQSIQLFEGHIDAVNSTAFSPDGMRIVSSSYDKTIRVWDASVRSNIIEDIPTEAHIRTVSSVSFSPNGERLLSCSHDGSIRLWDPHNGHPALAPLQVGNSEVNAAGFSPDGMRIVSGSDDSTIQVWDAQNGSPIGEPFTGHSGSVLSVCFSPDGSLIASSSTDSTIRLWSSEQRGAAVSHFRGHTNWVYSVCFSPDGTSIMSGSRDQTVGVWNVKGDQTATELLVGHTNDVHTVSCSPDGARIVSGSADSTIRIWDSRSRELAYQPLFGHDGIVHSVHFSPDGTRLASSSSDRTIRLWDAHTGLAIGFIDTGHTEAILSVCFSPWSTHVVSGSEDARITVWDVDGLLKSQSLGLSSPGHAHDAVTPAKPWTLQEDGWVVDSSRLLAWVPPDLRMALLRPHNTLLISTSGSYSIDFEHARLGESWSEIYMA